MYKALLLLLVFLVFLLSTWCFINVQDYEDIFDCMLRKVGIRKSTDKDEDEGIQQEVEDTPDAQLKCEFMANDILGGKIYTTDGDLLVDQPDITCADCTKYIYKDNNQCYKFVHDPEYNADNYCLSQEGGTCKDMCTSQFMPTACPF